MILQEEVEKLYWKQERKYYTEDQGDYAPFYEHLKAVFLKIIKNRYKSIMPSFTQNFIQAFLGNLIKNYFAYPDF